MSNPQTDYALQKERGDAQLELERRMALERGRYYVPNGRLEEALALLKGLPAPGERLPDGSINAETIILVIRGGNHSGKTALTAALANYLLDRVPNPYFDAIPYLKNFPKKIRARLATTANAAAKTYPEEFGKWLSKGQVKVDQAGRRFDSNWTFMRTGSELDLLTFDQDPSASESMTLNLLLIDEILPRRHWTGLKSRFRKGGLIVITATMLEGSAWISDELEVPERLGKDVFVIEVDSEDNCRQHGVRGVIEHAALAAMERDYDDSELEARRHGKYLHQGNVIYSTYRTGYIADGKIVGHEPPALLDYYRECWDQKIFTLYNIIDPHDLKPFALGWYAVFPNEKIYTVAEWPDESMPMFHKLKRWSWSIKQYVEMMRATEMALGKPAQIRLMDPNFGPSPKLNGKSALELFWEEGMAFRLGSDAIAGGHLRVKELLGDPAHGVPPRLFSLPHCRNHRYGAAHYGVKENHDTSKGHSETPELQHKDFMDLWRYGAHYGFRYLNPSEQVDDSDIYVPRRYANGMVGV